jgi:hypothetical protein
MSETNETAATETPAAETTEKKAKGPGVGALAIEMIRGGSSNEDVLKAIQEKFPEAKTTMASVNWYRNKLRTEGEHVPTARDLKRKAAEAAAAANPPAEKPKRQRKAKAAPAEATSEAPASEQPASSEAPASEQPADIMA